MRNIRQYLSSKVVDEKPRLVIKRGLVHFGPTWYQASRGWGWYLRRDQGGLVFMGLVKHVSVKEALLRMQDYLAK